ncbi:MULTISPECIES: DUF3859 domain-containing protein [Mameliella]|uniref:DUF3859 domain-containing protein n=1 Tax=Mameliella alba TaxID=561184 RepID=A0A0B3SX12_9RHOB|nr:MULTISPECIES: DUF3859 domain-containing protein [Mameliella]MCR9276077.1 DUF3859 domain-containing protein [Paracoccaceae bacterium]ODM47201.1 hypothetical protein A9320_23770 [Ruegeria sp. PBVC088]KHQ54944.1 hypothetical protein OA50_00781 [Mameliella alba]MBY6122686.1 DUF3859 domain-containing protein [Mameliella alba]MDD9730028.1 DUF3859 domain-containing protein [Mameliella sp. AT18]
MHAKPLAPLIAATLVGAPALADVGAFVEPPLTLEAFGVICEVELQGTRPAPDTLSGLLNLVDQDRPIDVETVQVPAEMGLSFGIRASLTAGSSVPEVTIVVTHPPMGPEGRTVERWVTPMNFGDVSLNLFTFERDYELVEGPWMFQVERDGKVLLQQPFEVTAPGTIPAVQQACFAAEVVS